MNYSWRYFVFMALSHFEKILCKEPQTHDCWWYLQNLLLGTWLLELDSELDSTSTMNCRNISK